MKDFVPSEAVGMKDVQTFKSGKFSHTAYSRKKYITFKIFAMPTVSSVFPQTFGRL